MRSQPLLAGVDCVKDVSFPIWLHTQKGESRGRSSSRRQSDSPTRTVPNGAIITEGIPCPFDGGALQADAGGDPPPRQTMNGEERTAMEWKCTGFDLLSTRELYSILRIRSTVFVVEYAHPHLDLDCKDECALHVFALEREHGLPSIAAYARLVPGDEQDPEITIDRVVTHTNRRDDETHDELVAHALVAAGATWPDRPIHIIVPADKAAVYERFGFRKTVGPFLEYGIPYIDMAYRLSSVRHHVPAPRSSAVQWISPPVRAPISFGSAIG